MPTHEIHHRRFPKSNRAMPESQVPNSPIPTQQLQGLDRDAEQSGRFRRGQQFGIEFALDQLASLFCSAASAEILCSSIGQSTFRVIAKETPFSAPVQASHRIWHLHFVGQDEFSVGLRVTSAQLSADNAEKDSATNRNLAAFHDPQRNRRNWRKSQSGW